MFNFIRRMVGLSSTVAPAIEYENRKKAAMALNLCTASISRIIDSQSLDVMELEYDAILNNLNLQNIIKDEALLTTMRSILDTISFYKIQAGDRKRMEARYQHKMNNALWDGLGKVNVLMFGAEPWTAAAMVAIQVGSAYCSVRRSKAQAKLELDDESWKLERSAMEQLHALRCSLFETAWRLADTYNFEDSWRLTIKQIDQYNNILTEPDPAWRYAKLEQYHDDFQAYPHFWFELAEAAFQASQVSSENRAAFLERTEKALQMFEANDLRLLRQDIISASARLRHVQLLHEQHGSWVMAIKQTSDAIAPLRKMACNAPDLLLSGAICYAAAHEESKDKKYAEGAISFLEMLVNRQYDMPTTSRLLSKLYLQLELSDEYQILRSRVGDNAVLRQGEEFSEMLKPDRDALLTTCKPLLEQQVIVALKMCFPEMYNCTQAELNDNLHSVLLAKKNKLDKSVQEDMTQMWEALKSYINNQLLSLCQTMGLEQNAVAEAAKRYDSSIKNEIKKYSTSWFDVFEKHLSSENRIIGQQRAYSSLTDKLKEEYVCILSPVVEETYSNGTFADITNLESAINGLRSKLAQLIERHGLVDVEQVEEQLLPTDFFTMNIDICKNCFSGKELNDNPGMLKRFIDLKQSFEIQQLSPMELFSVADEVSRTIERCGLKARVFTYGRSVVATSMLLSPAAVVGAGLLLVNRVHELCTYDPDYEIIRYPNKLVVRYTRLLLNDAENNTSEDSSASESDGVFATGKKFFGKVIEKLR